MIKKPFNRAVYDAYDRPARGTLVDYLVSKGHSVVNNEENYGVDVVTKKGRYTYFNEVEVKSAWKADWPTHWSEIRIPERKQRLLRMNRGDNCVLNFYVFRHDMKQVWRIKDTLLITDSLKEAHGRGIVKGERFFHIPYTQAELVTL